MRHLTSRVLASALITSGLLFQTASSQTKPANKTDTGTVSGRVTVKGKGLPGIVVGLRTGESNQRVRPILKGTTDEDGKYRITNVPAGVYQVAPIAPAFVFYDYSRTGSAGKDLLISEGEVVEGFDFTMVRGGVITGKVTDSEGRPVVEEFVKLELEDESISNPPRDESVHTDDRGIYRAFGVPPGRYRVSAGLSDDGFSGGGRSRPAYRRTFYPDSTDSAQATVVEVGEATEATNIDLTLVRMGSGVSVSGRVVDGQNGEPVGNVQLYFTKVTVQGSSTINSAGRIKGTNSKGEFRAEGLTAGKYFISLNHQQENYLAEPVIVDVLDQDVTGVLLKTTSGATLDGIVVMEGSSKAGGLQKSSRLFVSAFIQDESPRGGYGRHSAVKADGKFHITGLPAGTVFFGLGWADEDEGHGIVVSRIERDGVVQPAGLPIQDGEQVTGLRLVVTQGTGTIRGTVKVENGTIQPDGRVFISLSKVGATSPTRSPNVDARGHFLITGLTSGSYEIQATVFMPRSGQRVISRKQSVTVTDGVVSEVTVTVDAKQLSVPLP